VVIFERTAIFRVSPLLPDEARVWLVARFPVERLRPCEPPPDPVCAERPRLAVLLFLLVAITLLLNSPAGTRLEHKYEQQHQHQDQQ
jgi:hypothetical protein